ncbi:MAG: hypothetical protein RAO92_06105, partial [Candidatus Euphemobacter frigidus]|nr:hypothetical protein [Candidatus Euphemobacter frigidus]
MASKVHITLEVDDKGSAKIKGFAGNADKAFAKIKKNAGAGASQAGRMEKAWGGAINNMKNHWKAYSAAAGVAMAAMAVVIVAGAKKAIAAASDLQEVQGKFDVVFAGQEAKAEAWAATLVDAYAMSNREAKQYLSSVQDLLVPMGMTSDQAGKMSNEVVKLAADLGSFNNMPTAQVMENIQSALTGEYESMKKYGVVINATTVQQRALNMGLAGTKDALTAGMKAEAAYALMVEGSTAAIGDMARTQDSAANQEKQTKALLEDISALLGGAIIPYYQAALKEINGWLKANKDVIAQNIPKYIGKIGDAIVFSIKVMRFFSNAWLGIKLVGTVAIQAIAVALDELFGALRFVLTPLDLIFAGLVKIGALDVNPFDSIERGLGQFRASSGDVTKDVLADIKETNEGYDKTISTIEGWSKELKENAKAQAKASKSIVKDVVKQNKGITAAAKKTGVEQVKIDAKAVKAREKLAAGFSDKYQKLTLGDYDYAVRKIRDQGKAYERAGSDHVQVEEWVAAEIKDLADKGSQDKIKADKDYAKESTRIYERLVDDVNKNALSEYQYKDKLLDKQYSEYKKHLVSLGKENASYADGVNLLDTWLANEKNKLWKEEARKHGGVLDTMKVAWSDFSRDNMNTSQTMYDGWTQIMT